MTRKAVKLNHKNIIILLSGVFILALLLEVFTEIIRFKMSADDAIRWTLWVAIATIVSATGFFLIQQQEEYQKRRAEEEKEAALKYQYLEQRLVNLSVQLENHAKLYGHDGVYELMGRVIQVESDHKAVMFLMGKGWKAEEKSDGE